LNKTIDVVVLEQQSFQIHESFELRNVGGTDDVVKSYILKRNLNNSFLKLDVIEYFQGISIDKKKLIPFNLGMTRLHQTVIPRFLSPLVAIQPQRNNSFHFIFPFLADNIQQSFWAYVFV